MTRCNPTASGRNPHDMPTRFISASHSLAIASERMAEERKGAEKLMPFICENCAATVRLATITVTRHDLWLCGDHDERPLTKAFIACSWACAAALTADLAKAEPEPDTEPF